MRLRIGRRLALLVLLLACCLDHHGEHQPAAMSADRPAGGDARKTGSIQTDRLVECSGIDASTVRGDLLWAINDGGNGPYVYALGANGRDRGRVRIEGAQNRDWEDLATFMWQGRPMILVADVGDNHRRHGIHTLYLAEEPRLDGDRFHPSSVVQVAWRIVFAYPDGNHDAEGVAVDAAGGQILIISKRDAPPLLYTLPLKPAAAVDPVAARRVAAVDRLPPPTDEDRRYPYGEFRSQPTALDISMDGRSMVVLTYKHAYLFKRAPGDAWETIAVRQPTPIPLPLPQDALDLRQREAVCFSLDGESLFITSEGQHAGLFQINLNPR